MVTLYETMTTRPETGSIELWLKTVKRIIAWPSERLSLLDLCCNECTGTGALKWAHHLAVDLVDWPTRKCCDFIQADALDLARSEPNNCFDVCICSDGIEHLRKEDGRKLLSEMTRVARVSIIFTPLGPYMLDLEATHPDAHKSAWTPEEFKALDWQTEVFPNWHPTLSVGAFFAWKRNYQ